MSERQRNKKAGPMGAGSPYLSERSSTGAEQGFIVSWVGGYNTEQARAGAPSEILATGKANSWPVEGHEDRREVTCSLLSFSFRDP